MLQHPAHAETLGRALGELLTGCGANVVLSPALGGLIIGHEVARALGVRAIFAERQDSVLTLRRGFSLAPADRVVVIEDVVTTGGSTRETMAVARASRARPSSAPASIIDRSGGASKLGVPFHALVTLTLPTYHPTPARCAQAGMPIIKPGSRTDVTDVGGRTTISTVNDSRSHLIV